MENLAKIRTEYARHSLTEKDVDKDPIEQFRTWLKEAMAAEVLEPTAMNIATVSAQDIPSSRIVLLKEIRKKGFVFYTNYQSNKGRELDLNPFAALNFFWPELERQVRIQGIVNKVSKKDSERYFHGRPKSSQIGTWASPQSAVIKDRKILEDREKEIFNRYRDMDVLPKPEQWGGYIVEPFLVEFWQGRPSRLHDRIVFTLKDSKWQISRLAP